MGKPRRLVVLIVLLTALIIQANPVTSESGSTSPVDNLCHFGIAVVRGFQGYDIATLGVGAYLDWSSRRNSTVAETIHYLPILTVGEKSFPGNYSRLDGLLESNRGAVWIIGNEPDYKVSYQDNLYPEVYAQYYYNIARRIRALDPSAKIGFGTVIQPSPIRMHYIEKVLVHLDVLAKRDNPAVKATSFIDVYTIHAFNLNEQPLYVNDKMVTWGAGVPLGYNPATWPAQETIILGGVGDETWKTHDINIFKQRIIRFRDWMKAKGEQNKPLWITEYGSLFPSVGVPTMHVSEQDAALFMERTFDFMLSTKDHAIGYPGDDYRLVQHWVWYSLNDELTHFGGSLFDPNTKKITYVGQHFADYNPPAGSVAPKAADLLIVPSSLQVFPRQMSTTHPGRVNYRAILRATNTIQNDIRTEVRVELYEGSTKIGTRTGWLPRCSGHGIFNFDLYNLLPGEAHTYSAKVFLVSGATGESNPGNDAISFPPVTMPPIVVTYLPIIRR